MTQISDDADRFLLEKDYNAAAAKYEEAVAKAQVLADRVAPTLKQLLEDGQTALNKGNAEQAQQKFNLALMIDPNNALAQQNLQRAQKLGTVMALMASGSRHEKPNPTEERQMFFGIRLFGRTATFSIGNYLRQTGAASGCLYLGRSLFF